MILTYLKMSQNKVLSLPTVSSFSHVAPTRAHRPTVRSTGRHEGGGQAQWWGNAASEVPTRPRGDTRSIARVKTLQDKKTIEKHRHP